MIPSGLPGVLSLLTLLLWWASLTLLLGWALHDLVAHRPLRRALKSGRLESEPRSDGALRTFGGDDLATNPELSYRYTRYRIGRGEVGLLRGRLAPQAETYSLTLYDTLLQSLVGPGAHRSHAERAALPVDDEGHFVVVLAHEDPGWPYWLDLGEQPAGVLMERHFGAHPESPSTLEVVEAPRLAAHLENLIHSENQPPRPDAVSFGSAIAVFLAAAAPALVLLLATATPTLARADGLGEALKASWPLRALRLDADAPLPPTSSYQAAARGERRTGLHPGRGDSPDHAWGVMVVPATIDQVRAALSDEVGAAATQKTRESYLLEGAPCASGRTVLSFADLPAVKDRYWLVKMEENEALHRESRGQMRELRWRPAKLLPGRLEAAIADRIAESAEVTDPTGSWLLLALPDGRTLVEYHATTKVGGAVPMWLVSRIVRIALLNTLAHVRDFAVTNKSRCTKG